MKRKKHRREEPLTPTPEAATPEVAAPEVASPGVASPEAAAPGAVTPSWAPLLYLRPEDYPDVSGMLTEDRRSIINILTDKQRRLLIDPIESTWAGREGTPPIVAMTGVGLYMGLFRPTCAPDFLLAEDVEYPPEVTTGKYRAYFVWEFDAQVPRVVVEIVTEAHEDESSLKLDEYVNWLRVAYYVVYDPRNKLGRGVLRMYNRKTMSYEALPELQLPGIGLGLGLTLWHGTYSGITQQWLRWCDERGELIPTGQERAEQEKRRADALEQRVQCLRDQLRAAGLTPAE